VSSKPKSAMSVLSTNVNTIRGMTNHLREARQIVEEEAPTETKQTAEQLEERILLQGEDSTLALARKRIEIECLLRNIPDAARERITDEFTEKVAIDNAYRNPKRHSDKQNARIEHDDQHALTALFKDGPFRSGPLDPSGH
jgi:hypothetical protein